MDTVFTQSAWVIPMFPLLAFLLLIAFGRKPRFVGPFLGITATFASLVVSVLIAAERWSSEANDYSHQINWIHTASLHLTFGFEVNNINALMLLIVSLVSFLVNLYSLGYMENDERINVYYAYVALFTFSMLGLVISENLLQLYIFWELVGVSSFLLIGFWYDKPAAKAAAKKAFIVTRIGDVGLLAAILLLYWNMPGHALDFTSIHNVFSSPEPVLSAGLTTAVALLILLGAAGKSGQLPLHTWLPDAMEGPTPISALIHAATMVAAGVYLIARTFDIFAASETAMTATAVVGALTALFAATVALVQSDMKRVLAYSTISQLGYMVLALGVGAAGAAMFHLFTHAFFKALLFLAAGSVIHRIHRQNIREMGGLAGSMRWTAGMFAAGALALAGVPPFSGFWSKDAILAAAYDHNVLLFIAGLATAFLTALYMTRLFVLVFMGKPGKIKAAESPGSMIVPMIPLAVLSVVAGFVETPLSGGFGNWLGFGSDPGHGGLIVPILSAIAAIAGIALGWHIYVNQPSIPAKTANRWPGLYTLLEQKYYFDQMYDLGIVQPLRKFGLMLQKFDQVIVGGTVRRIAGAAFAAGRLNLKWLNGQIQTYGLITLLGCVVLAVALVGRRLW
jgi:NADH-quinone oxidoreductase subunit L